MAEAATRLCGALPVHEAIGRAVVMLAGVVSARARGLSPGASLEPASADEHGALAGLVARSAAWPAIDAHWLGVSYERALDAAAAAGLGGSRRRHGVFYTPSALVRYVLDQTLEPVLERGDACSVPSILDPACGCGAFLIEAARRVRAKRPGLPAERVAGALTGVDIDQNAAVLCRLALWLELGVEGGPDAYRGRVRVGDSLTEDLCGSGLDVVVGNPPFLSQLASATASGKGRTARLRERFGASVRAYTDPAALFLQLGVESARPGGRVGMVLPVSVLASRDAAAVRARVSELGAVCSLWLDSDGLFDAGVRTTAVVVERGAAPEEIARWSGSGFARAAGACPVREGSWGPLGAGLAGIPSVDVRGRAVLSELCDVTAGFRDEYYAIVGGLSEGADEGGGAGGLEMPVATVGMIEPFALRWGACRVRIGGREWLRPCVDESAGGAVGSVIRPQKRAKLVVATQSPVIEVAADPAGRVVALTPVISAFPRQAADLWRVGAALASPVVAAWGAAEAFGTARSLTAVKPSAALLRRAPLPVDRGAWDVAAERFRGLCEGARGRAQVVGFGEAACAAYGVEAQGLMGWWVERVLRG